MLKTTCITLLYSFLIFSNSRAQNITQVAIEITTRDDISSFKKLIRNRGELGRYLFLSVKLEAPEITKYILSKGIPVNAQDSSGTTPLIIAVSNHDIEMVKLLLTKGANPNMKERSGLEGTPLMYACASPSIEIPSLLINNGADVNIVDVNLDPAINWATYYGNTKVIRLLIDKGADLSLHSKHGTSVDVGLRLWHADSVMEVFRTTSFNKPLDAKQEALLHAVGTNDLTSAKNLISSGAMANGSDGLGTPFLQIAAESGNAAMLELLLTNGADPNRMNRVGQTPIAFAARFKHHETVRLLLHAGADPNLTDEHYRLTPLMGAAVGGDIGIGLSLLKAGAMMEATDSVNQCSSLHWSMFYGNADFTEMLLLKGADFNKKVLADTYTGISLAEAYGYNEVVRLMNRLNSEPNPLVGSWRIDDIHYIYKDTTIKVDVHQGRFSMTPNRYHIIYNPWITTRTPFEKLSKPTDAEIKHAFQSIVFNTGTYVYSDSLLTTTADIAKVPGFEGGKQYYQIEWKGDKLELTMADETYPSGEKPEWYQKLKILFKLTRE